MTDVDRYVIFVLLVIYEITRLQSYSLIVWMKYNILEKLTERLKIIMMAHTRSRTKILRITPPTM